MRLILAFVASAVLLSAFPAAAQTASAPSAAPADLVVANRRIVTFRTSIGTFTPAARVAAVTARIKELAEYDLKQPVVAKPVTFGGQQVYSIEINGKPLLAIQPADVDSAAGENVDELVRRAVAELNGAREAYLELHQAGFLARNIALSLAALFAFFVAWNLLARLRRGVRGRLTEAAKRHVAGLASTGLDVTGIVAYSLERLLALLYYGAVAIGAYLCVTFGLRLFAFTHPWGDRLAGWLLELVVGLLHGAVAAIPGLFAVFVIFLITRLVLRGLRELLARVERGEASLPGVHPDTAAATRSIGTVLIWLFALTVAFPYLPGSDSDVFKGISLFAGLMVTLGSSGIVAQWMAGITLIYSRAMRRGDLIKAGDNEGVVTFMGLLSTKIQTATGEEITIPNSSILSGSIQNYTRLSEGSGSRVVTTVTIGYDAPWRQVHAMLLEAARRTSGLRTEPPPFVLQRALGDFYVEYELVGRIDEPLRRPFVMTRLHGNVQDVFNEHGVQILSPHFMAQPAAPVVVDKANWYAPPAKPD